ncbi:MAG: peptidyl-prolyl cis-trans isomerase [Candidatus Omnitrophica bacterium]|nr:peptidyl-prolyl cis-trans isomerase [Candidatus Omnitrophota bacterium]
MRKVWIISLFFIGQIAFGEMVNRVVAVVNKEVITEAELISYARNLFAQQGEKELNFEHKKQLLKKALDRLIEDRLILSYAKKMKIPVDKIEVENRIKEVKKNFQSEIDFLNALEKDGLTYEGLYARIYNDILKRKAIDYFVRKKIEIHPQELQEYYTAHIQEFQTPERVKLRKIFISKKNPDSKKKAEEIHRLMMKSVPFEDLAKNHSDSQTFVCNDGEWIEKGKLRKDIEEVVFSLKSGEISPVIETENGFYIFQVVEKTPPRVKEFKEVKDRVYQILYRNKFKEEFNKFIQGLKKDAEIEVKI